MSNLGFHTDNNFEYGDEFGRIAGTVKNGTKHLAAITSIMNPNDLGKAAPAINAAVNQALRFHNVETNMSGTDQGQFAAQQNVTTVLNAIKPALSLYPNARWAYFRNEIGDWTKADFYALEMKLWIEGLAALGYYGGICCWSFGTPSYELWPKFDTALAAANANGAAVLLHEYGVLTMKSQYDAAQGRGHHCLRYRNVWAQNNYPARFPKLMWWVTETGLDKDVNTGVGGGWKESDVTADKYLADLYWYDSEISRDGVSATVYQWGTEPKWAMYDIQGQVVDNLLAHVSGSMPNLKAGGTPQTPPGPIEIPPTPPARVNLLSNGDFQGGEYAVAGNPNQQHVPVYWTPLHSNDQVEFERDPHHVLPGRTQSARVYESYLKEEKGLWQNGALEVGARYRLSVVAWGWCTTDPVPFTPSDSPATLHARIDGVDLVTNNTLDEWVTLIGEFVATGTQAKVTASIKPQYPVTRTDIFIGDVYLEKVADAPGTPVPPTKPTPPYEGTTTRALNARLGVTDTGYFLKELPTGTSVKVIGYSSDGKRTIVETSILADGIKPK